MEDKVKMINTPIMDKEKKSDDNRKKLVKTKKALKHRGEVTDKTNRNERIFTNDSVDKDVNVEAVGVNVQIEVENLNRGKGKRRDDTWKRNALTVFENSFAYPFVHAGNKYKCFVCSESFLDASILKSHTNGHNVTELRRELYNKVREKSIKVDVSDLCCKICQNSTSTLQDLKEHLVTHGKFIDTTFQDNLVPYKLNSEPFVCQICGETFLRLRLLIIHMSKHFNNYSCEICGSVFISLNLLRRHHQTHETGSFACEKCDKVFSSAAKKTLHVRGVHLKQYPRRCPICSERFNSNYQRTKHLRIVHNQTTGLFRCETCSREYDLKYHLLIHIRSVHLQERNQECSICHSRFFSKYCLSRHMVIHTGEKNYKCVVCGKAYARRKNLREHSRCHDGGQICTVCGQDFDGNQSLIAHMNSTHGVLN